MGSPPSADSSRVSLDAPVAFSCLLTEQLSHSECVCAQQTTRTITFKRLCQNGTRASEASVAAEKRQETGGDEEGQGSRSKDGSQGSASVQLLCVQVPDARPKNLQATLREQAPKIPSACRVRGSGGIDGHPGTGFLQGPAPSLHLSQSDSNG